jgi:putative transposase
MRQHIHWKWRLDEVYVKINGDMHYLWRAVDRGRGAGIRRHQDERQGRSA